jgi:hypothetical protein
MRKNRLLATLFGLFVGLAVLATTSPALAGGKEGTIGVGAEYGINGFAGGGSVNYDAGLFHVGGFLGLHQDEDDDEADYTFGARFYYHLHDTPLSDFGIGGMLGFYSDDNANIGGDRLSRLFIEPGVQFRAFIATNVALSFTVGLSLSLADGRGIDLDGQLQGLAGVHYYFFK